MPPKDVFAGYVQAQAKLSRDVKRGVIALTSNRVNRIR
jgi:hypothetical protein